jgi:hypothetical protein
MTTLALTIATDDDIEALQARLASTPERIARARSRTFREMSPWVERQVLRTAVAASGIDAPVWQSLARFNPFAGRESMGVWLGTRDIPAHHLGNVVWSRTMSGARAGGQSFPHAWSWEEPRRTGGLIMRRSGAERLPIEVMFWKVHQAVLNALEGDLLPRINQQYQSVMLRQLNYELNEAA